MKEIDTNLQLVKEEIHQACLKVGRAPADVKLIAVSKNFSAEKVQEAYDLGQREFGENRVQELVRKQPLLPADIEWHLIGTLQRNKVKEIIDKVSLIHSVHKLTLAQEISKYALRHDKEINILLQVNIAMEESKSGFEQNELLAEIKEISKLPGIKIKGLMTIAPLVGDPEEVRPVFRQLNLLARGIEGLKLPGVEMNELSMGMSEDFRIAIEEGATLVRIGSRIFGQRN